MPTSLMSIILLMLLVPVTGNATIIRQRPYRFSFEAAVAREEQQFVVCSNCPDSRLTLRPVIPPLAVRLAVPEQAPVSSTRLAVKPQTPTEVTGKQSGRTETVLFAFDSAQLSQDERSRLGELIKEFPESGPLEVTGYTCSIGSDAYNEQLALNRAKEVAAFLSKRGLTIGAVFGRGKCCPVSSDKRLNRRVEIREHERGRNEYEK